MRKKNIVDISEDVLNNAVLVSCSIKGVIDVLGYTSSSTRYEKLKERIKFFGIDTSHFNVFGGTPKNFDKKSLTEAIKNSGNVGQVILELNGSLSGTAYKTITKYAGMWDIDTSHFSNQAQYKAAKANRFIPIEEFFIIGKFVNGRTLKKRMIEENLKGDICEECGQGNSHNGMKLVLQLDHINGKNTDNRLENLRILCPNCHTQTSTWGFKRRTPKPYKRTQMEYGKTIKLENDKKWKPYIKLVEESEIDFSKRGWVKEVSVMLGITHQKVNQWMKRNMNTFYEENCCKRRSVKSGCATELESRESL